MKWTAVIAFVTIGLDCADKALGGSPQVLFATNNIWIWWIAAAYWFANSIIMCFARVEP